MMRCDHCQNLLLDHAYGLLDAFEAAVVEEHLAACESCSAARAQAERMQGLFARAARTQFPNVHFTPPAESTDGVAVTVPAVPATLRLPQRTVGRAVWARWAVAATVLAMIPGALLPLKLLHGRYESVRSDADSAAARLAELRASLSRTYTASVKPVEDRFAAAKAKHDRVLADWLAAERAADQTQ